MYKRLGEQPQKYKRVEIDYENQVCTKCGEKMDTPRRIQKCVCSSCKKKYQYEYGKQYRKRKQNV